MKHLKREGEWSKPNIEEIEMVNLAEEGEKEKPVKIGINFPKDMKDELIALLRNSRKFLLGLIKTRQV